MITKIIKVWALSLFVLTNSAHAAMPEQRTTDLPSVILITLDGVRWREVFEGEDPVLGSFRQPIFRNLIERMQYTSVFLGNLNNSTSMEASNDQYLSMPGYQSIMAGTTQNCFSNTCGRIMVETMQERLVRDGFLQRQQVASIGSWKHISDAVEHIEGTTFTNTGLAPLRDSRMDPELDQINRRQLSDKPQWQDARYDKYTWAHSMRYLQVHRPRFLYIALHDSDEWAHQNSYPKYVESLRQYDQWIYDLFEQLGQMGIYGQNVTVIVTTNHGRGEDHNWTQHSMMFPTSKYVWLFGRSPYTQWSTQQPRGGYTHLDIRPTIETALGLRPTNCRGCGKVIEEIVRTY